MASIKTLQAFTVSIDGELQSFAYNTVYDVDADMASELIDEGLAESYGGGGGGDFSIATMTVSVESGTSVGVTGAMKAENGEFAYTRFDAQVNADSTIDIIMCQGNAMVQISSADTVAVSGNIQLIEDTMYAVSGDCTVTVTGGR